MHTVHDDLSLIRRFFIRLLSYSSVGLCTFALDMVIIAVLHYQYDVDYVTAVGVGFLIGVSLNYILCYFWVYRGTERNVFIGFILFLLLALAGIIFITHSVRFLVDLQVPLLIARSLVAGFIGMINFLLNTFFNFKLL